MRTTGWVLVLVVVAFCVVPGCGRGDGEKTEPTKPADGTVGSGDSGGDRISGDAKKITVDCGNGVTMELVSIPSGKFMMGNADGSKSGPRHEVILTNPFWMGVTEVTQAQYTAVMGKNPSHTKGEDHPVEYMLWLDAEKFCKKLSEKTGKTFRLPTEAEWEYACRAGTDTPWYWGGDSSEMGYYAVYSGNGPGRDRSSAVGTKKPNPWGLYDVIGNVWELVSDNDSANYNSEDKIDPTGNKAGGGIKVARGGSMNYGPDQCNATFRLAQGVGIPLRETGFRVVCEKE